MVSLFPVGHARDAHGFVSGGHAGVSRGVVPNAVDLGDVERVLLAPARDPCGADGLERGVAEERSPPALLSGSSARGKSSCETPLEGTYAVIVPVAKPMDARPCAFSRHVSSPNNQSRHHPAPSDRVDETLCRVRRDPNAHKARLAREGKSRIRLLDFDVASDSPAKPRTVTPHRKAGTSKRWLFLACAARHEPHFPRKGNDAFPSLSDSAAPPGAAPVKIARNSPSVAPEDQRS